MFEQPGTFKNEFKKMGYDAVDYDILNDYGQTDYIVDLFAEIKKAYNGEKSIFDNVQENDLILAFFPCTRFSSNVNLSFRGENHGTESWSMDRKIEYAMKLHEERHEFYMTFAMMCVYCIRNNKKIIIENPYSNEHYLTRYFPLKSTIIDYDRSKRGDYFKKPTQYWFINVEPKNNFIFEPVELKKRKTINHTSKGRKRSEISSDYANRFIREFILEND